MTLGELTSHEAVVKAIRRYDELGAEQFLRDHHFKPAPGYLVRHEGNHYDCQAIAGAAYGLQYPDRGNLPSSKINGGPGGAARRLTQLGFTVVNPARLSPPKLGDEYPNRTAIYDVYGGDRVAGIVKFPGDDTVNAFSDEEGPYADEPPDVVKPFEYRGDGRVGDQTLIRGNKKLDDARQQRRAVRFWYRPAGGTFTFVMWVAVLNR